MAPVPTELEVDKDLDRQTIRELEKNVKQAKTKKARNIARKKLTDVKNLFKQKSETVKDIIRGKIASYIITASKQSTADGIGGDLIDPNKIREKVLSPYEKQFLDDMDQDPFGVSSAQFEAEIYKDLFDKRIINIESTIDSEGKAVGQYFTFSPFDVEALRKAEIEQEKENKKILVLGFNKIV